MALIWWGADGDSAGAVRQGLLRPLLGQTVIALEHATLIGRWGWEEVDHEFVSKSTLVFTLTSGRCWELLDAQSSDMESLVFKEVEGAEDLVTSGDLEREDERPSTAVIESLQNSLPWQVDGITELWSNPMTAATFRGFILWSTPKQGTHSEREPLLAIFADTDELRAMSEAELWEIVRQDHFYVGELLLHFYNSMA